MDLRSADEDVVRGAEVGGAAAVALSRGDLLRALLPFCWPVVRKGDAVRLRLDGVLVREGGLLGRLMDGLSHEEKKSSSGSPAGVLLPEVEGSVRSFMVTSSG